MTPKVLHCGIGDDLSTATLYYGQDVRESLKLLPDESVHMVATSPPYFGLRSYLGEGSDQKQSEIGSEETPELFVASLVEVFREVRRVLRPDGTLWVNLGDSYSRGDRGTVPTQRGAAASKADESKYLFESASAKLGKHPVLKQKDLIGAPWRVAFALQADGWWLRQDIIWQKPNPLPESVTDRCTKSHEYVFLLSKSERYHFDHEAIREPAVKGAGSEDDLRNRRSVWTVPTSPYRGAHFATWPTDLVELMIKAGCPEGGTVLDPFSGSATTGLVATRLRRDYVGIDLNREYLLMAEARLREAPPPGVEAPDAPEVPGIFDLFAAAPTENS
jgi:DNA modification methylase